MLTDDDLTRLLGEAASAYDVPEEGLGSVLEERGDVGTVVPLLRRRWVQVTSGAAALVVLAVLLQSLGGASTLSKSSQADRAASSGTVAGGTTGGGADAPTGLRAPQYGTTTDAAPPVLGAPVVTAPEPQVAVAGTATSTTTGAAAGTAEGTDARVVKTGTVTLLAGRGKVPAVVAGIQRLAVAPSYVASQSTTPVGDNPAALLTLRVPVASFDNVIRGLQGLGAKVVSVESSSKDITAEYADTEAQIGSLKAARARFLTILSGAKTISETLTVQQRVDDVQGQIDRLEGQRRLLASQSDLATLSVSVSEQPLTGIASAERTGFSKAWHDATHGFSTGVQALIAHSGRALLVLILGALALLVLRPVWRLARRRLV